MRGKTYKRCGCKDVDGTRLEGRCPQLRNSRHGSWYYIVDVPAAPGKTRRQRKRGGFATERAAEEALTAVIATLNAGSYTETNRLTVNDYLTEWLAAKANLRPSTRKSYQQHLDLYLAPRIGSVRLSALRGAHIERMMRDLREGDAGLGVATSRRVFATLRGALNKAVRQGLLATNPCANVELESEVEHRRDSIVWEPAQARSFLKYVADNRLFAMYQMVITCGLRRGEVIGVRWEDVDLDAGLMLIHRSIVQIGGRIVEGAPKTKRSKRVVPLDRDTIAALRIHRRRQAEEQLAAGEAWANQTGRVFTRDDGALMSPEAVSRNFKTLSAAAGVPVIRFHDLRHTSASLALAGGVPMRVVSDRLGHSTIAITSDLYTKVYDDVAKEAAERIAGMLRGDDAESG
jgi:integrase